MADGDRCTVNEAAHLHNTARESPALATTIWSSAQNHTKPTTHVVSPDSVGRRTGSLATLQSSAQTESDTGDASTYKQP